MKLAAEPLQAVHLSARQRQCLELIAAGETSASIARILGLSRRTVDHYVSLIYAKLGVRNRAQAVGVAVTLRIISLRGEESGQAEA